MSRQGLMPLDEALAALLSPVEAPTAIQHLSLNEALGRVLADDQFAGLDVPPADNSAMDGYAVRAADASRTLAVSQRIAAGDVPAALADDSVARIFTGAAVPAGADAIVMQEDVLVSDDGRVQLPAQIKSGQHIRRRGQDCRQGDKLLGRGRRLLPQDLGLLASQGLASVPVFAPLKVALLSTGSELVEPGTQELPPGAIFNSNRPMLRALLEALGCVVLDLGIVADDFELTRQTLASAAARADLVLSSGGVSVGEADHVRDAVQALGSIDLWRIAIKPGKPFAHGRIGDTPFVGLPGNPSSAYVTFVLLARPYLCALQGRSDSDAKVVPALADFAVSRPGSRREYLRVSTSIRDGVLWAAPFENQSSGVLSSVSHSDALAIVPIGATISPGDRIEVLLMESLLR